MPSTIALDRNPRSDSDKADRRHSSDHAGIRETEGPRQSGRPPFDISGPADKGEAAGPDSILANFGARRLDPDLIRLYRRLAGLAGIAVASIGILALTGWSAGIPLLTSFHPSWVSMKANTAVGFLLSGLALFLAVPDRHGRAASTLIVRVSAGFVAALGLATLAEYASGWDFGIDQLLVTEPAGAVGFLRPGRMTIPTALNFMLCGSALLSVAADKTRTAWLPGALALPVIFVSTVSLYGYLFGADELALYSLASAITATAFPTSTAFVLLGVGIFLVRVETSLMSSLASAASDGFMLRRMLPVAVLLPLGTVWLRLLSQAAGLFSSINFDAAAVSVTATIIMLGALLWYTTLLNRIDNARLQYEGRIESLNVALSQKVTDLRIAHEQQESLLATLERQVEERTDKLKQSETRHRQIARYARSLIEASLDPLVTISPGGKITDVNEATVSATGIRRASLIGTDFSDYFTEPEKARAGYQEVLSKGAIRDYPLAIRHVSGKITDVLYNASVYSDGKSEVAGIFASARDVTGLRLAEKAVRLQADQYATMLITTPDGFWRFDKEGHLLEVNNAYCRMSGFSRDELLKMRIPDIEAIEAPEETAAHIRKVMKNEFDRFETKHRRKDGKIIDVDISVSFWRDKGQFLLFARDISERKRAEETIREQAALIDLAHDAIIVRDLQGRIVSWNHGAEETYGWLAAEAAGRPVHELLNTGSPVPLETIEAAVRTNGEWRGELGHTTRAGKRITVDSLWSLERDEPGEPKAFLEVNRNVTERNLANEELARYRTHLEELVAERTANLTKANAELEAVNDELEAFSYSVSHDLRTPLRAIDGFSRILVDDYADKLNAEGRRIVGIVRDSTKKMGQLIDDVLAFSRIGRQEVSLSEIAMDGLVRETLKEMKPGTEGRDISFDIKPLPPARGDATMMKRVWTNLLENAIKFTGPKPQAAIEVGARSEGNEIVYYVKDNGVGFDMQYVKKLFGVFQRLHAQESFSGTGIGLAIVKRIIARHGGRVRAEGKVNEGATFYFMLPATEAKHD